MRYLSDRIFTGTAFLMVLTGAATGQETLLPLTGITHPAGHRTSGPGRLKVLTADTLELPFFDDFSREGKLPDEYIWTDNDAFINNSYAIEPVTIGVATLDAVSADGSLNGDSREPFPSDYLTTKPINLDYPGRRDIYLSFFYQPQGLGDNPETGDSLLVDFYAPGQQAWITVWADTGQALTGFRQVFIPVLEDRFLKKGFRFRFMNYASLPRSLSFPSNNVNVDHWNIDYVYLDSARSSNQTAVNDVAMVSPLGSLLKEYEAIPWPHFKRAFQTQIKPRIRIVYSNNDTTGRNVTRILEITDLTGNKSVRFTEGTINLPAGRQDTCLFSYNFPFVFYLADSVLFGMKSWLITDEFDYKWNDTVKRYQEFYNYYALDDGSAEAGYGLQGEGTVNARVAFRFQSYEADSLRGVQMYFNRSLNDAGSDYFMLSVWGHNKATNRPGNLRHSMLGAKPVFGDELNEYRVYELDSVLFVDRDEVFYVGWIKTTTDMLNVGFDRNTDNRERIYYNLGQQWNNSSFKGSLMIRPLMGKRIVYPAAARCILDDDILVCPNPASEFIRVEPATRLAGDHFIASIQDMQGALVLETDRFEHGINISGLPAGIYLLILRNRQGEFHARKFIIQR